MQINNQANKKVPEKGFLQKSSEFFYLASYWFKTKIPRMRFKHPLLCSFKITGRCNLKCMHCPFWREKDIIELSFEKVCAILRNLHYRGIKIIIFEGGEPLLWQDRNAEKNISDVIEYAKDLFFYVGVTTNGTQNIKSLTDKTDIVFISIDGMQKTHDSIRGKSFDKIIKNIDDCGSGKKIIANICISRINIGQIKALINFLNDKVYGITIQFFYPYDSVDNIMLTQKEKNHVLNELKILKKSGLKILNSKTCLEEMAYNTWKCADFLVCSVEKDGAITFGCYLKNKVEKANCAYCGFAVHCEISLAYRLNISALKSAAHIFWHR